MIKNNLLLIILIVIAITAKGYTLGIDQKTADNSNTASAKYLKDFSPGPYFGEQIMSFHYNPEVKVEIDAPGPDKFDPKKKVLLIFYGLPNMNTIAETIGKKMQKGDDWHYNIQHIGAQTRFLRNVLTDYNIVVAYMATDEESWPWWKMRHPEGNLIIRDVVDSVESIFEGYDTEVDFCSHSGGGTFVFGYINSVGSIPNDVKRIAFIDSEYDYSDSTGEGNAIVNWLKAEPDHFLSIIAYDDRHVIINGKDIGTYEGGTFYRSMLMKNRLAKDFKLKDESDSLFMQYSGLDGRINIQIKYNPQHLMWHTVLVEDNGFIHSLLCGTKYENKGYTFWGARAYSQYIQP